MVTIIDVSEWQGAIDWKKVHDSGVKSAIIRAGFGLTKDKRFAENAQKANAAGVKVGFYWYATNSAGADEQAHRFVDLVKSCKVTPELPLFCDYEKDVDKAGMTAFVNTFCEIVRAAGYNAGIYSNTARLALLPKEVLTDFVIWCADWRGSCGCKYASYWQYASNGKVSGISGYVDLNKSLVTYSVDDIATKVIAGEYGNGAERVVKLTAEGYDADAVQKRVNDYYAIAKRVISGAYGNGSERVEKLKKIGYDYKTVQNIVNVLLKG